MATFLTTITKIVQKRIINVCYPRPIICWNTSGAVSLSRVCKSTHEQHWRTGVEGARVEKGPKSLGGNNFVFVPKLQPTERAENIFRRKSRNDKNESSLQHNNNNNNITTPSVGAEDRGRRTANGRRGGWRGVKRGVGRKGRRRRLVTRTRYASRGWPAGSWCSAVLAEWRRE